MNEVIPETNNFRLYLQDEYSKRCSKNRRYSIRAFAKTLGIYHATLSALLSGKRPFTEKSISSICDALNLSPKERRRFQMTAATPFATDTSYSELTLDLFAATSEWYYDAILELTHTKGFRAEQKWIAKKLGISTVEVNAAVERLIKLELLKVDKAGRWVDSSRNSTTIIQNNFTTLALRRYQQKILELSAQSITDISSDRRDHTSMTVAIRSHDLPEIKEKIRKFRRDLTAYIERAGPPPDSVYQLAVSFFPLTKGEE